MADYFKEFLCGFSERQAELDRKLNAYYHRDEVKNSVSNFNITLDFVKLDIDKLRLPEGADSEKLDYEKLVWTKRILENIFTTKRNELERLLGLAFEKYVTELEKEKGNEKIQL